LPCKRKDQKIKPKSLQKPIKRFASQEALRCGRVLLGREEKVEGHAGRIHRTIQVAPLALDPDVGLVDRGMANPENLATIQAAGYHWSVAAAQPERVCYFDQYEEQAGCAGRRSCENLPRAMKVSTKCVC
jgi:hypothetical protein